MAPTFEIAGRVAVVTGAGSAGVGLAVAKALHERCVFVALVDDKHEPQPQAYMLSALGVRAIGFKGDLKDADFIRYVHEATYRNFGAHVTISVPCAEVGVYEHMLSFNSRAPLPTVWDRGAFTETLTRNFVTPIYWVAAMAADVAVARRNMQRQRWSPEEGWQGRYCLLGSIASEGEPGSIAYGAAKAALVSAMKTLNLEWEHWGISGSCVHPGFLDVPEVQMARNMTTRVLTTASRGFTKLDRVAEAIVMSLEADGVETFALDRFERT